jgi:hypothetical protein
MHHRGLLSASVGVMGFFWVGGVGCVFCVFVGSIFGLGLSRWCNFGDGDFSSRFWLVI